MNTKVVQLMNMYNFYFDHFFIWQILSIHCSLILHMFHIIYITLREMCHIYEQCRYHFVVWRNDQYKSCRSLWVIQLWYLSRFQLKSFGEPKSCLKLLFFEIQNLNCSNFSYVYIDKTNKITWYRMILEKI
jgi:hypothetical protein